MDIIEAMKNNESLYFLMIIWGGGILFGISAYLTSYIGKSESGMKQVKRGVIIGSILFMILTMFLINYSIQYARW
jgi:hypothetical protein